MNNKKLKMGEKIKIIKNTNNYNIKMTKDINKKIGIVLTTHFKNYNKIKKCLESILLNTKDINKYIILFDNEGDDINTKQIPNKYNIDYIHIKDQSIGGLTYTWNKGIDICFEKGCDGVILLNHDTQVTNTFKHLIYAILNTEFSGIFSSTTNKAPWGNHCGQQTFIKSNNLILKEYISNTGLGGYCLGFKKETLIKNKFNETCYFNPDYLFGGNEYEYGKRWFDKKGRCYMVSSCYILHTRDNSWTKLKY